MTMCEKRPRTLPSPGQFVRDSTAQNHHGRIANKSWERGRCSLFLKRLKILHGIGRRDPDSLIPTKLEGILALRVTRISH